jgi:hypothetical protein
MMHPDADIARIFHQEQRKIRQVTMTRNTLVWAAGLLAMGATAVSSTLIWLLVTRPTMVATAAGGAKVTDLLEVLVGVIYEALLGLVQYL